MFDLNDFIYIPEGDIEIGIDASEIESIISELNDSKIKKEYIEASSPLKKVHHNQFYIKKKLITTKSFKNFITDTSYITEAEKEGWGWVWNNKWQKEKNVSWKKPLIKENNFYQGLNDDNFPVMQVTWNDALEYTKWLSSEINELVRLPYEHEWEVFGNYAGLYSIRNSFSENSRPIKSENDFVMVLKRNIENSDYQLGLLWEWTLDWYKGYDMKIYNKDFGNIYKTLRGGSLLSESIQNSKEFRFRRCPTARSPYYGFRIVIDAAGY